MPTYHIPTEGLKSVSILSKLSDEQFSSLYSYYDNIPINKNFNKISDFNLLKDINIDEEELDNVNQFVYNLFRFKSITPGKDIIPELLDSILFANKYSKHKEEINNKLLTERLIKILSIKTLALNQKAENLLRNNQRNIYRTKIITDIRPVLDSETNEFNNFVILHRLEITYGENFEQKVLYFTLDAKDLSKLKEDVIRAEQKEQNITKKLENSNINKIKFES